ncbi:MAG: redoxin domain-containing protein [Leptospiraceae bacterium]|nr:redoxin domain-containing protein [Leptospiraceae bacterium]
MKGFSKPVLVLSAVLALYGVVALIFYFEDLRYSLPTPKPENFSLIPENTKVSLPQFQIKKPTLVHFFNPECPCSKFNFNHIKELKKDYLGKIDFIFVLETKSKNGMIKFKEKFDLGLEFLLDPDGSIAKSFGVYSTPQAVLLSSDSKIYYRGNYNSSRYCNLRKSQYARIAIEELLKENELASLPQDAKTPYGCELPSNKSKLFTTIFPFL